MRTARKIRYRLEWLGLKFATKFLPLLSRKACYRLALLLGSLGAMLDRRGRRVALSNLRVGFGDEISSERRAQIVRESYQHFARTMLDFFWSPRLTSQNFSRYVKFEKSLGSDLTFKILRKVVVESVTLRWSHAPLRS
jgi:lauroyl/myristoyl acyltransferase